MRAESLDPDRNSVGHILGEGLAETGAAIRRGLQAMGPLGRRFALTGLGALTALALGAGTAEAFRLPAEVTDPPAPQDPTLAMDELPSQSAARANALENPPAYPIKAEVADASLTAVEDPRPDPADSVSKKDAAAEQDNAVDAAQPAANP